MTLMAVCAGVAYGQSEAGKEKTFSGQGVTQEVWEGVRRNEIESLKNHKAFQQGNPSYAKIIGDLDITTQGDEYGARYTAYITPPESGEYTFWLAADDAAELYLSSDESPEKAVKIAELNYYTGYKNFQNRGKSQTINLEKGKRYYLSLLHKEGTGDDYLSVAWSGPGLEREVVKKEYLTTYLDEKKEKALERTAIELKQQKDIVDKFLSTEQSNIMSFLDSLSQKESSLLSKAIATVMGEATLLSDEEALKKLSEFGEKAKGITASLEHPLKNSAAKKLLYLEEEIYKRMPIAELKKLGAHRLSAALGEIPKDAKPVKKTVKLNSNAGKHRSELVSTGFYALPGVPFKITVPKGKEGLTVQVGHHIEAKNEKAPLVSMPETTRRFNITEPTSEFITPHGGLILLDVPPKVSLDNEEVTGENVILAPRFVLGETTDEDWKTIKNNPAPWGELVSEYLTMVVPGKALQGLDNPTELMTWWNENNKEFEDFYAYYPKVAFRMHSGLYAREGISYWPLEWKPENIVNLLDIGKMKKVHSALYLHEHGHHADFGDMEFGYTSESTPNWAGYYMKSRVPFDWKDDPTVHLVKLMDPNDAQHNEIKQPDWYKISTKGTHHWSYPVTSMMLGYTEDFGWEPFKKTLHRLRDRGDEMYSWPFTGRKTDDQAKIDRYVIGLSQEAKRDVRPYFAHFQMLPSEGATAYLDKLALPKWDATHLPPPAKTMVKKGESLTIPNPGQTALTMAGEVKITWQQPANGAIKQEENGDLNYTPNQEFTGEDKIPYTMTTPVGESPIKYLTITVEP